MTADLPALETDRQQAARRALENAEWERDFWANRIAEGRTRSEGVGGVIFVATPEVARRYAEAVAAVAVAREALLGVAS